MAMPPVNALNTLANKKSESHIIDGQVYLRYGSAVRGYSVFYHLSLEATFKLMYANKGKDYHFNYLDSQIQLFRSSLVNQSAQYNTSQPQERRFKMLGGSICYKLYGRTALITAFSEKDAIEDKQNYSAGRHNIGHTTTPVFTGFITDGKNNPNGFKRHMVINGAIKSIQYDKFGDTVIEQAANLMPDHMVRSGEASMGELQAAGYQLHFSPHDISEDDAGWKRITKQLGTDKSSEIQRAAGYQVAASLQSIATQLEPLRSKKQTLSEKDKFCWTVQGSGMGVMENALMELKQKGYKKDDMKKTLAGQKVYFSNPIGNRFNVKKLVEEMGMEPATAGLEGTMSYDIKGQFSNKILLNMGYIKKGSYGELVKNIRDSVISTQGLAATVAGVGGPAAWDGVSKFVMELSNDPNRMALAMTSSLVMVGVSAYIARSKISLMLRSLSPQHRQRLAQIIEVNNNGTNDADQTLKNYNALFETGTA